MIFKLKTSRKTMEIFEEIGASVHLQPFALSKLAISLSLRNPDQIVEFKSDNDGLELNRQTITGDFDDLYKALIIHHNKNYLSDEEYFPKYLKAHLDRGAIILYSEYKYANKGFYQQLLDLDKSI